LRGIKIFRIFGIEVELHSSWFLIFFLLSLLLFFRFQKSFPGFSDFQYGLAGFLTSLGLFFSILFHELCHSLIAIKFFKIKVLRITLFFLGGIAQMKTARSSFPSAKAEGLITVVGPFSSFFFAGLMLVSFLVLKREALVSALVLTPLFYLYQINLLIAFFNLLPILPLDGGRIFRAICWFFTKDLNRATTLAGWVGRGFILLCFLVGVYFLIIAIDFYSAIRFFLIGAILHFFLEGALLLQKIIQVLSEVKVKELMISLLPPEQLPASRAKEYCFPEQEVAEIWEEIIRKKTLGVIEQDRLIGLISYSKIREYLSWKGVLKKG
jgi:Zn-dependent protease